MTADSPRLKVLVEKPDENKLRSLGVRSWPIWTKEPSSFDWSYDEQEMCYFLDGDVTIKTSGGNYTIQKGDFVTFPKGLSCRWVVKNAVRKHYHFG